MCVPVVYGLAIMAKRKRPPSPPILLHAAGKVGGMSALAEKIGITRQGLYQWKRIPAERVIALESITGIPRHELRPDLYPKEAA